jgi:hypothetical protein
MFLSSLGGHASSMTTAVVARDRLGNPPAMLRSSRVRRIDPVEPAWHSITRAAGLPRLQVSLPALLLPRESIGQ